MRLQRILAFCAVLILSFGLSVGSAYGWANGKDMNGDGIGDDGYGTHDWIIEHAIKLAGSNGSWVHKETARLSSDDPDGEKTAATQFLHIYKTNRAQGAPQAIADEYYKLMQAYQAGNHKTASYHLGRLSHYYADICQPFHTEIEVEELKSIHDKYERSVSAQTNSFGKNTGWIKPRGRKTVGDVRTMSVSAALYSRSKYKPLAKALKASSSVTSGATKTVTSEVLSRAVNDLADIIVAAKQGKGMAAQPATVTTYMSKYYPAQKAKVCSYTKVLDKNGKPLVGVGVQVKWPVTGGHRSVTVYTGKNGIALWWLDIGSAKMMDKRVVEVKTRTNGRVVTKSSWFTPSPKLGAGKKGVKTTLSNRRPKRNTVVKAKTKFKSASGKPVKGLKVTFTWQFKSGTKKTYAYTNASGNAYSSMNIAKAKKGYPVRVRGRAMSGGSTRSSSITFTPK